MSTVVRTLPDSPRFTPGLSEEEATLHARLFWALGDPTRQLILSLLSEHEGKISVSEIAECLPLEQPTTSHHLKILKDAGLVSRRKHGTWVYYYVRREVLARAKDMIDTLV